MLEPVYDGYFADPFLARFGDEYFVYGTADPARDDGTTFEVLRSPDLRHWRSAGSCLVPVALELGADYWAPEVAFADGSYWLYYSVGHGIDGHHIRVARSSSPIGPFDDLGLNLTPDESFAIDAHPFLDDDGSWYLYFAADVLDGERPGTHLAVAPLHGMTRLGPTTAVLAPDADWQLYERDRLLYGRRRDWYTLEGPTVVKREGGYRLLFSGGSWEGAGYGVSAATASSPLGPWLHTSRTAEVLNSADTGLIGPGHCSVLHTPDGRDLLAFHAWNPDRTKRQFYLTDLPR
ncbi:glycoside hydrolase family 43 protein [Leifsonia poae]|uniref:glycoside hydrolase family 43 protein n=1 Tax=Leifsonia poae TaxID=110933 RepID=UPI001CC0E1C1|nr:glycoside hydrolase family 43 protein [Leifsonia poae]